MPHIADVAPNEPLQEALRDRPGDGRGSTGPVSHASQASARARPTTVIAKPAISLTTLWRAVVRLIHYRDLLYTLTAHRLSVRYKQSVLGPLWAVLQPVCLMVIYTVVFSRIARVPSEGIPYAVFAYAALVPWLCFSTAVSTGTSSLVAHVNLVTKVYFPRVILPLTYVLAALVDLLLASTVLGVLMFFYGIPLTINVLYAIPTVAVLATCALAVALALSAVQVRYRDIGIAMPLVLQLWLFASPIVYPLGLVPERWHTLYLLNPMAGVIENFRRATVLGEPPDTMAFALSALVSMALLPVAFMYFTRVEATVADEL